MIGIPQLAIAFGLLGAVIALMGLFPGVTGIEPGEGIGVVQFVVIMFGFSLLDLAALFYVKASFYVGRPANLAQQIGVRLSLTGLVLATLIGLADFLGFGSNLRSENGEVFFGPLQAGGMLACLLIAALGVVIYAVTGDPPGDPATPDELAEVKDEE